jgi:RNA polymerase sigma-70 factor (ECF subfamily)
VDSSSRAAALGCTAGAGAPTRALAGTPARALAGAPARALAGGPRGATVVAAMLRLVRGWGFEPAADPLVRALEGRDREALGRVYEEHHHAVRAFARRLLGDDGAAEDLVHEVFVTLPAAARRFRGESGLRTFLLSIAANHCRHHVRAAARRRRALGRLALEPPAAGEGRPDDEAERARLADALSRALDALPLDQRLAFVLCEVEERPSHEAATILGAPEGTVRSRLRLAREKLRALLAAEGFR